jgi:hypothetical protein
VERAAGATGGAMSTHIDETGWYVVAIWLRGVFFVGFLWDYYTV